MCAENKESWKCPLYSRDPVFATQHTVILLLAFDCVCACVPDIPEPSLWVRVHLFLLTCCRHPVWEGHRGDLPASDSNCIQPNECLYIHLV